MITNKYFEAAVTYDLQQQYLLAIERYEKSILSPDAPEAAFSNLSFLYWIIAAEFAFSDENNISDKWSSIGGENFGRVLREGISAYPLSLELKFWSKYFPHRMYFDPFTFDECKSLVENLELTESLVPTFFLHLFAPDCYKEDVQRLVEMSSKHPTAKNKYIISVANL